jgi:ABC-type ATPase with predicted acetyltransferase domain
LRHPSPEESKSSSVDRLPGLVSPCSSSSSVSYSSKMIAHDQGASTETKEDNVAQYANAVTKEMVLVGCPKCYMYVMSSEDEPKCPKCNTTVILDLFREED